MVFGLNCLLDHLATFLCVSDETCGRISRIHHQLREQILLDIKLSLPS